jgi:putative endonuclease
MYFAYILKSEKDGRYYYGSTSNLERRLAAHNAGKVRSTKGRRPLKLIYFEQFTTRSAAFQREQFFKSFDGYIWLKKHRII